MNESKYGLREDIIAERDEEAKAKRTAADIADAVVFGLWLGAIWNGCEWYRSVSWARALAEMAALALIMLLGRAADSLRADAREWEAQRRSIIRMEQLRRASRERSRDHAMKCVREEVDAE